MNIKALSLAIGVSVSSAPYAATLTIAPDLSGSNALLVDKSFALMAANHAANEVSKLKRGDQVNIVSFGARGTANNFLTYKGIVPGKNKMKKFISQVKGYIQSIPSRISEGQPSTNIVSFLRYTSGFDCANGSMILLISDGLEASAYVSPANFISGKKGLPEPKVNLKGCELFIYGLGVGQNEVAIGNMRDEWRAFAEKAGATYGDYIPN